MQVFKLKPKDKGKFAIIGPDGFDYGTFSSIKSSLLEIAKRTPLKEVINFQWEGSSCMCFEESSLDRWLMSAATYIKDASEDRPSFMERVRLENKRRFETESWA